MLIFVWFLEQRLISNLHSITLLVIITEAESVY